MHTNEVLSAGCAFLVMVLGYAFVSYRKRGRQPANGIKPDVRLLPPDQFCKKVITDRPPRMVIIHIGACTAPAKGRRYEFRTVEQKSGPGFRTYFDVTAKGSERPRQPTSENMRKAVSHIHLLLQAAEWHLDKRKGTLKNPAFYLEP